MELCVIYERRVDAPGGHYVLDGNVPLLRERICW